MVLEVEGGINIEVSAVVFDPILERVCKSTV
jgi:hypothetical protein